MFVVQKEVGTMQNFSYLVGDEGTNLCALVDPSFDASPLIAEARRRGCRVEYILITHFHFDHVYDNSRTKELTGARIVAHESSPIPKDIAVTDGSTLPLGGYEVRVLHTPGHSPDSVCYLAGGVIFTGDTLFVGECGRCDLPGSGPEEMYHSLLEVISSLDDDIVVYPGHDYGPAPTSTIGKEKRENYTLRPRPREEFIRFIQEP